MKVVSCMLTLLFQELLIM